MAKGMRRSGKPRTNMASLNQLLRRNPSSLRAERSNPVRRLSLDCFVAPLLAMTAGAARVLEKRLTPPPSCSAPAGRDTCRSSGRCDAGGATRRNPCLRYRSGPSAHRRTGACRAWTAMFFSWGRPWRRSPKARIVRDCRAYRRSMPLALGGADAGVKPGKVLGPALIDARKPAHQGTRVAGAATGRTRQDGSQFRRFLGVEIAGRFAESVAGAGLGTELAIRSPLGDVEVDFQYAAPRQHQVEPDRQRDFEHLSDDAAALPEE